MTHNIDEILIFEDNHLLALNKPAGMLTQPSYGRTDNLEDNAKKWIKKEKNKPGNVFLNAVHRLDRAASGIVLFAKTGKALSRMNKLMRDRMITKKYLTVTSPGPKNNSGRLIHYIRHSSMHAEITGAEHSGSKKASLYYTVKERNESFIHIEISLETGRYHQIRAQLSAMGWPIVGDWKYLSPLTLAGDSILLHHIRMTFIHPVSGKTLELKAPLPFYWPFPDFT